MKKMKQDFDNKYDTSFRRAELGVKEENEMDDDSDKDVELKEQMDDHFSKEPENFGGGGGWE